MLSETSCMPQEIVLLRFSAKSYLSASFDQFDLVPFGSVDERNSATVR